MTGKVIGIESRSERFAVGDLVRLRSGSPYMTVSRCSDGLVDLLLWHGEELHVFHGLPAAALQRLGEDGVLADDLPL